MKNLFVLILLFGCLAMQAQTVVSGTLRDANDEPLFGATVLIKGTTIGTDTDLDGAFTLDHNQSSPITLVVSYIGYNTEEIAYSLGDGDLKIVLLEGLLLDENITISASKRKEKITKAPSSVNIITKAKINQLVSQNPMELIGRDKGIDFVQKGVNEVDVNIRGFNAAFNTSTLYLTDGKLNTYIAANLPYGFLDPMVKEDLSRIEVILGPSSSLYGANAFSGLVNVTTKNPMVDQGTDVGLTVGNQNMYSARLSTRHRVNDKFGFKLSGEYTKWKDFDYGDSLYTALGKFPEVGLTRDHKVYKGNGAVYYNTGQGELMASLSYSNGDYNAPTSVGRNYYNMEVFSKQLSYTSPRFYAQVYHTSEKNKDSYTLSLASFYKYLGTLYSTFPDNPAFAGFQGFSTLSDDQLAGISAFKIDHSRIGAEAQYNNYVGDRFNYILGVQGLFDKTQTQQTSNWDFEGPISQSIVSAYAHGELKLGNSFRTIGALRLDHHDVLGVSITPKIAFIYDANENSALRLTYGRGFKYPSIQQANAFILNGGFFNGHNEGFTLQDGTKIKPVSSTKVNSFELGYKTTNESGKLFFDASVYYEINKDFISSIAFLSSNPVTHLGDTPLSELENIGAAGDGVFNGYTNFGRVDSYGADFKLDYKLNKNFTLQAFYSYFNYSKKLDDNETSQFDQNGNGTIDEHEVPINTPANKLGLGVNFSKDKYFCNVFAKWVEEYNFYNSFLIASADQPYEYRSGAPNPSNITANSLVYTHPTFGEYFNRGPLGGYINVSINAGVKLTDVITVAGSVSNLFDAEVRDMAGAPTIGRLVKAELKFNF